MSSLPDYVVINKSAKAQSDLLKKTSRQIEFPLSTTDKEMLDLLVAKYEAEENIAGLAAVQIGFPIQAIVFAVPAADETKLQAPRNDIIDTMEKTLWLNATYEAVGTAKTIDYEACFSVNNLTGPVPRYDTIQYEAYDLAGTKITGVAHGFLARVIQHEIDHTQGILFTDLIENKAELISHDKYREILQDKQSQ